MPSGATLIFEFEAPEGFCQFQGAKLPISDLGIFSSRIHPFSVRYSFELPCKRSAHFYLLSFRVLGFPKILEPKFLLLLSISTLLFCKSCGKTTFFSISVVIFDESHQLEHACVMSRVHQENFSKLTNWTGACDMPYERSCWTNRWSVGQDDLVVTHWDFWLRNAGSWPVMFFAGDVFPTGLPRRSEQNLRRSRTKHGSERPVLQLWRSRSNSDRGELARSTTQTHGRATSASLSTVTRGSLMVRCAN